MTRPAVSVVMATRNQAPYIRQALDSLRGQTMPADEIDAIVINDGSTDGTAGILHEYAGWIRLVAHEHRGLVHSCNEGLAMARGRYFTRLDSDDWVATEWLARLAAVLDNRPGACCACPDRYEVSDGEQRYAAVRPDRLGSLIACGTLLRTQAVRTAGGYRPFYWEEYDLYLRLREAGEFVHVPHPLYFYRLHAGGMTARVDARQEGWVELARAWGLENLRTAGLHPEIEDARADRAAGERGDGA